MACLRLGWLLTQVPTLFPLPASAMSQSLSPQRHIGNADCVWEALVTASCTKSSDETSAACASQGIRWNLEAARKRQCKLEDLDKIMRMAMTSGLEWMRSWTCCNFTSRTTVARHVSDGQRMNLPQACRLLAWKTANFSAPSLRMYYPHGLWALRNSVAFRSRVLANTCRPVVTPRPASNWPYEGPMDVRGRFPNRHR